MTSFQVWASERIDAARIDAEAQGISVELSLLRSQWLYVDEINERWPELGAACGLFRLGGMVLNLPPDLEPVDPEAVQRRREVLKLINDTRTEFVRRTSQE